MIDENQNLFAAYCGLIASGYDLTDPEDRPIQALAGQIRSAGFPPEVSAYFRCARTGKVSVNPYYPRGSDLAAACYFLDAPLPVYLDFLLRAGSPEATDAAFADWISALPVVLKSVKSCEAFPVLWLEYRQIVMLRSNGYLAVLRAAQSALDKAGFSCGTQLIFSPSLLQAPCLADFVRRDGCMYLIAARCTKEAALHEFLHEAVRDCRPVWRELLARNSVERFVNLTQMRALGYADQDTENGRLHAFEDGIVRGLTAILASHSVHSGYARSNQKAGFGMVPQMIRYARKHALTKDSLPGFIAGALSLRPDRNMI